MEDDTYGSISGRIIDKFLNDLGITRHTVNKVLDLLDTVEVKDTGDEVEIDISLKNVSIIIKK